MTQAELISHFPPSNSIEGRVLLLDPSLFAGLNGLTIQECRIFLLVTAGSVTLQSSGRPTVVNAGNFLDMLVWEPVMFTAISDDCQAWCLLPNYLFTNESLNGLKPEDSESFKDRHAVPVFPVDSQDIDTLGRQFRLLLSALKDTGHIFRTELCRTYFRSFLLEAGNRIQRKHGSAEETESIENRQDTILRSFLKLVWKYYRKEHNIDFYATRLCLSSKHLSRVVSAKLGKTPYAVIREELLQRATYLLKDTKIPVQDIAADLHFSEMAAFCKFFKKNCGMSPTAYRLSGKKTAK